MTSVLKALHFKVAGLEFTIKSEDPKGLKRLIPSYAPFCIKAPSGAVTLMVEVDERSVTDSPEGETLGHFDCGGAEHSVYRLSDGYKMVIRTLEGRLASAMRTNADFSRCRISLFGSEEERRFGLCNAMMIAFTFSAVRSQVVLMHASVTMYEGRGYLFLGKSGTGKSTHSRLWITHISGADLLNDDNPAVRVMDDGSVRVFGTPWSGKTPCYRNLSCPVGAFLRLEQHPENIIRKESPVVAFASVISSCSTMIWDKPSYTCIVETVNKIAGKVPAFYLKCRADKEAALLSCQTITSHDAI